MSNNVWWVFVLYNCNEQVSDIQIHSRISWKKIPNRNKRIHSQKIEMKTKNRGNNSHFAWKLCWTIHWEFRCKFMASIFLVLLQSQLLGNQESENLEFYTIERPIEKKKKRNIEIVNDFEYQIWRDIL